MTAKKVSLPMCTGRHCDGKGRAEKPHSCPYAVEIGGDPDPEYCTCCDDCRQECAWDI